MARGKQVMHVWPTAVSLAIASVLVAALPAAAGPTDVLAYALAKGDLVAVKALTEQGADLNSKDAQGLTPLMWAARMGSRDIVAYLVAHKANLNPRDAQSLTPLMWAAYGGHTDVAALLASHGANRDIRTRGGQSAADIARQRWPGDVRLAAVCAGRNDVARTVTPQGMPAFGDHLAGPILDALNLDHPPPGYFLAPAVFTAPTRTPDAALPSHAQSVATGPVPVATSAGGEPFVAELGSIPSPTQAQDTGSMLGKAFIGLGKIAMGVYVAQNGNSAGARLVSGGLTAADGAFITTNDEMAIGLTTVHSVVKDTPLVPRRALQAYVDSVGQRIVAQCPRRDINYYFRVTEGKDINAFAAPGGFIFVTRAALAKMKNEAELANVLGHETGHVTQKHSVAAMQASFVAKGIVQAMSGNHNALIDAGSVVAANLILKGYSREQESEADAVGIRYANAAGYNPRGIVDFFNTLTQEMGDPPHWLFDLTDHPETKARIQALKPFVDANSHASVAPIIKDADFQAQIRNWLAST
jgi:Zn-dependent protease with chaperone function